MRRETAPYLDRLFELDPAFHAAASEFTSAPLDSALEPRIRELLAIAINASTTQLYLPGVRLHIRNALRCGATREEIMEVLQLTSVLGIHTCTLGVPILIEELLAFGGKPDFVQELMSDPRRQKLKLDFTNKRGYWRDFWENLLALDPDFFEVFLEFSSAPWINGPLPPKIKEFVYIAIDSSTTHLFGLGLRLHIQNALHYGASKDELMEILKLTSAQGMNACAVGIPILQEELCAYPK